MKDQPLQGRLPGHTESLWTASAELPAFPPLQEDIRAEAAVVGGGIAGLTTAYLLAQEGVDVALIESGRLLYGTTGHTTAKVTVQHGLIYHDLLGELGEEKAKQYYEANREAMAFIRHTAEQYAIPCGLTNEDSYMYAKTDKGVKQLEAEINAYDRLGIEGDLAEAMPLELGAKAAIVMRNQSQFHPLHYLKGLLKVLTDKGVRIYERTRAVSVDHDNPDEPQLTTAEGRIVSCRKLVVASQYPFCDRVGAYFARLHTERSYVLAIRPRKAFPGGMYISVDEPVRSLRSSELNGEPIVLVGGENHKTGLRGDTLARFETLKDFGERLFGIESIPYRWSAQDVITLDRVPYVGSIARRHPNIYVATGFRKWGMTNGTASALLLRDLIAGRGNPYAGFFDPARFHADPDVKTFVVKNTGVAKDFVRGKLETVNMSPGDLGPDEGSVVTMNGKRAGAYKDSEGRYCVVDTTCTHMGCELEWNSGERSWDCPCHGSRFSYRGEVIEGPATQPLKTFHWPEDADDSEIEKKDGPFR